VKPPGLSVVVVTRDEEERIRTCLESVAWADELIVIDAESQDKTAAIARELTDHVVVRPWPGYAAQKNYGLEMARGAWILSLDADETVSPALREEIQAIVERDGPRDGYEVPRRNIFWGRWVRHGGLYPDWQLRLFRRGRGRFGERAVHESARVDGAVGRLTGHLEHRSYRDVAGWPPTTGWPRAGACMRGTSSCVRWAAFSECTCSVAASSMARGGSFWPCCTRTMC
jgi:glycosyltransferase involved in cell wall biosynthesis